MKKLIVGGLLSVAALFTLSCGSDDEGGPKMNLPITFMAEGAEFHYYNSDFFNEDSIISVIEDQIGQDTFLVRNYSETATVFPTQYWVLKGNNFYSSFRLRDPESYVIECKFNKPKGTSWNVVKGGITYKYTIKEVNATVTTGEGEVNDAVKIQITNTINSASAIQYISPSVGIIGTGNFEDLSTPLRLVTYKLATAEATTDVIPAITFGNFPFLKVGNYWEYNESSFFTEDDVLTVTVESKLPATNIYKVHLEYASGSSSYGYWYEDNGYLMAYDEGEEANQADPIYLHEDQAELGYGWAGFTESGTVYIYKIEEMDVMVDSYFGSVSSMGITVTSGFFSTQTNYWNINKGNVLVSGLVSREITASNAKQAERRPFIPVFAF